MLAPAQLLLCYLYQSALLIPCAMVNSQQHNNKMKSTQGFVQWSFSIRAAPKKPYVGQKLASAGLWHQGADGACPAPGCASPHRSASREGTQPYDFGSWQSTSVQRMTCIHNHNDSGFGYLSCWHTSNSQDWAEIVVWEPVQAKGLGVRWGRGPAAWGKEGGMEDIWQGVSNKQ